MYHVFRKLFPFICLIYLIAIVCSRSWVINWLAFLFQLSPASMLAQSSVLAHQCKLHWRVLYATFCLSICKLTEIQTTWPKFIPVIVDMYVSFECICMQGTISVTGRAHCQRCIFTVFSVSGFWFMFLQRVNAEIKAKSAAERSGSNIRRSAATARSRSKSPTSGPWIPPPGKTSRNPKYSWEVRLIMIICKFMKFGSCHWTEV